MNAPHGPATCLVGGAPLGLHESRQEAAREWARLHRAEMLSHFDASWRAARSDGERGRWRGIAAHVISEEALEALMA